MSIAKEFLLDPWWRLRSRGSKESLGTANQEGRVCCCVVAGVGDAPLHQLLRNAQGSREMRATKCWKRESAGGENDCSAIRGPGGIGAIKVKRAVRGENRFHSGIATESKRAGINSSNGLEGAAIRFKRARHSRNARRPVAQ